MKTELSIQETVLLFSFLLLLCKYEEFSMMGAYEGPLATSMVTLINIRQNISKTSFTRRPIPFNINATKFTYCFLGYTYPLIRFIENLSPFFFFVVEL